MRLNRVFFSLATVFMLMATIAAPAFAQSVSDCADRVADPANILGANKAAVDSAASTLETAVQGTVRVLVINSTNGNATAFRQNTLNVNCKNDWGDGTGVAGKGHERADLLAVIVGMDRQDDVYTGARWSGVFQKQVAGQPVGTLEIGYIQKSVLEPSLKNYTAGNGKPIADGIIASLKRMQTDIGSATPAKPAAAAQAAPAAQTRPAAPAQSGPNPAVVFIFLLAAVLVAVGLWFLVKNVIRSHNETGDNQQQAINAKNAAVGNVNTLDDKVASAQRSVDLVPDSADANSRDSVTTAFTSAKGLAENVAMQFGNLRTSSDPSIKGVPASRYKLIADDWKLLNRQATEAHAALNNVTANAERLRRNPSATVSVPSPAVSQPSPPPPTAHTYSAPREQASMPPPEPIGVGAYRNADNGYEAARAAILRTERYILDGSNVYYVRQSTWDDFLDAKRMLDRDPYSARQRAESARRDAERDVRDRRDQRRERWFGSYYGGYTPYPENNTLIILPVESYGGRSYDQPVQTRNERGNGSDAGGSWDTQPAAKTGNDAGGSWGPDTTSPSPGSDAGGSWAPDPPASDTSSGSSWDSGSSSNDSSSSDSPSSDS